jgi:hypothetical protein
MRAEFQKKVDAYAMAMQSAKQLDNENEQAKLKSEFDSWYLGLSEEEKDEIRPYFAENLRQVKEGLKEVRKMI